MLSSLTPKSVLLWLSGFLIAFFLSIRIFNEGTPGWKNIITSDGRGYYAYLPALLLDRDPGFAKVVTREAKLLRSPDYKPGYRVAIGDRFINKYFAGEALLLLPFFLAGTFFAWLTGTPVDGYSFFFQFFIGLGSLFYLMLGLIFLKNILAVLEIKPAVSALTILLILAGSNLFYYGLWQPTMSHIYSFFAINGFCLQFIYASKAWKKRNAIYTGFFLGITLLIRPTNAVVILLIPFFTKDGAAFKCFVKDFLNRRLSSFIFISTVLIIVSIQIFLWILQTGQFVLWPYRNEGFRFASPEILNVLFSYRKGLFIYTPLIFVAFSGWIVLFFRSRLKFISMTLFLVASIYIIASWWCWYYGDGFGLRAFIDYYGIFAILLAFLINLFPSRVGVATFAVFLSPFIFLNLLQTWQYTHLVIQPNSMNKEKYQFVFLRTDSAVINSLGGNEELADYSININRPAKVYTNDFERDQPFWIKNHLVSVSGAFSGKHVGYLDSNHQYSPGIAVKADEIGKIPVSFYIEGELMIKDSLTGASDGALVVLSMDSINGGENWWQGFRLNDVPKKSVTKWSKRKFSLMTPVISNPRGILKVYIWNTGKIPLLIDDFSLKIFSRDNKRLIP